jgi:hypothetical protein
MRLRNSKEADGKLVAVDFDGFISIPAGTRLTFIMSPEVLDCVDTCAQRVRRSRASLLLAMIVGKEIDPESAIFVLAGIVEAKSTFYGPLVFEYRVDGEDLGLQLDATQDLRAMPEGEVVTVLVEIAAEAGN